MLDTTCITYNNPTHERFQQEFEKLYKDNFTYYHAYKKAWLKKTEFYKENKDLLSYEKYAGYFLWKPFCISHAMSTFLGTPSVLYCDSNLRFKDFKTFEEVYNEQIQKEGVFFVKHKNNLNGEWTKRDTFIIMNADRPPFWEANQLWTVILGFSNTDKSKNILRDYLYFCKNPQIVTEVPNELGENLPNFKEHRWEQSVLSILAVKYNIQGVWDVDMLKLFDKVYDEELYKYKDEVNKNPLKKNTK